MQECRRKSKNKNGGRLWGLALWTPPLVSREKKEDAREQKRTKNIKLREVRGLALWTPPPVPREKKEDARKQKKQNGGRLLGPRCVDSIPCA